MGILIRDLIGFDDAITSEDGQKVYDLIYPELSAGRPVVLDFTGIEAFGASFFNSAIGQLLRDLTRETLNRLLKIENIRPVGDETVRLVIGNSYRYYHDPDYRKALDEVMETMWENILTIRKMKEP